MVIGTVAVKAKVDIEATCSMLRFARIGPASPMKRKQNSAKEKGPDVLREAIRARKWSQASVAKMLKVSKTTVSRWLSGQRTPGRFHMAALRELLQIPIDAWI